MPICILAAAQPAPLMSAFRTSHMVASVDFFSSKTTFWAFDNTVEQHVVSELLVAHVFTRDTCVASRTTFEAH